MNYFIEILPRAQKELSKLPEDVYLKIRNSIRELSNNARPQGCLKLTGRDGWRIVLGDYRVIYEIDDKNKNITILHVGHRRDIYR